MTHTARRIGATLTLTALLTGGVTLPAHAAVLGGEVVNVDGDGDPIQITDYRKGKPTRVKLLWPDQRSPKGFDVDRVTAPCRNGSLWVARLGDDKFKGHTFKIGPAGRGSIYVNGCG